MLTFRQIREYTTIVCVCYRLRSDPISQNPECEICSEITLRLDKANSSFVARSFYSEDSHRVRAPRFERGTLSTSKTRSNQLSYARNVSYNNLFSSTIQ